ncbi:UDP-glycosyltransferase 73C4-like [Zingiber officinale]|uniref:Glycosyltransferase n=1 Tax=Zingiber officinale TaxID=94328 RepID=A0A8J5KAK2_ZINOF|nr:UDP-glycosyltransferase 73C4-like [Zingiber officinale]KAG6481425.1 hypothetical protein ZIOFF_058026 [Zingiber officinale]
MANGEIIILPFHDSGHVFPATELASRLAARNYCVTLLLPSAPSTNSSRLSPLIQIVEHPRVHPPSAPPASSSPPPAPPFQEDFSLFRDLLHERMGGEDRSARPVCAIVDVMMGQALDVCREFGLPAAIFFTSSACSAAMDYAAAKIRSGESDALRGLPEEMDLPTADLMRAGPPPLRPRGDLAPPPPPFEHRHHGGGPIPPPLVPGGDLAPPPLPFEHRHQGGGPIPPGPPPALAQMDGAIALLFNTCDDLEHPFLEYLASKAKKPIWGIGPLLPSQFWSAAGSVLRDGAIRSTTGKGNPGAISESDVIEFLDSKPHGSVLYVSFGSIVIPSDEELQELTEALKESSRPFIWALQRHTRRPGAPKVYFPEGLAEEAKGRGMVIHGWAPQLLILSHPAVGGFVTHCGWNSTVEALGLGVPVLAWPVHGDQVWNAKLVVRRLRTGLAVMARAEGW